MRDDPVAPEAGGGRARTALAVLVAGVLCLLLPESSAGPQSPPVREVAGPAGPRVERPRGMPTLMQLARSLADAPELARVDFAWIALDEMAQEYAREASVAAGGDGRVRLAHPDARWMLATRDYAGRLRSLADGITLETRVRIATSPAEPLVLLLEPLATTVAVTGARLGEPDYMGARIVTRYCELWQCPRPAEAEPPAAPRRPPPVSTRWSFAADRGPVCSTSNLLEFRFADARALAHKRAECLGLARELETLAAGLQRAVEAGSRVEWELLRVLARSDGRPDQVVLNRRREYIRLSVPAIAASPALQTRARPWLRARVLGEQPSAAVIDVGHLRVEPALAAAPANRR